MSAWQQIVVEGVVTLGAAYAGVRVALKFMWVAIRDQKKAHDRLAERFNNHVENHGGH